MSAWNGQLLEVPQTPEADSFIGGVPNLPAGTRPPVCSLCGGEMSFLLQAALPPGHPWAGRSLALFFCLDCFGHQYCIPELPPHTTLAGADIPEGFLDRYQRNFRVLVFDTDQGVPARGFQRRVAFRELRWTKGRQSAKADFLAGGRPVWIMGQDETPGLYAGEHPFCLLLQLREDFRFPREEGARAQYSPFTPDHLSPFPWYDLFARDRLYFWGTEANGEPKVYISVQAL